MKKPNITPGDWQIDQSSPSHIEAVSSNRSAQVAYVHHTDEKAANLRAIAALPKLLEALEAAQACFDNLHEVQQWDKQDGDEIDEAMNARDRIRVALIAAGYTND